MDRSPDTRALAARIVIGMSMFIYLIAVLVNRANAFTDFRVMHLGSKLIGDGRAEDAYDVDGFISEAATVPELSEVGELGTFLSTPPFALALRPLTLLSANTALIVWMAAGIVAVFAVMRILRLPLWAGFIVLALPFSLSNIFNGQTGFLALLWAGLIHRLVLEDKVVAAGLVAGLAVLKPTLLLGVALWWLLDWRRWYPALLGALGVGVALVLPTIVGGFDSYRLFASANSARSELGLDVYANQPTFAEVVGRLTSSATASHPVAMLVYLAIGAAIMKMVLRRWPDRRDVLSGAAVLVSLLVSPHLLIYDTTLVVIPFAVAVHAGVSLANRERLVAIYVVSSLMMIMSSEPFGTINTYMSPATVGMVVAGLAWLSFVTNDPTSSVANNDTGPKTLPSSPVRKAA